MKPVRGNLQLMTVKGDSKVHLEMWIVSVLLGLCLLAAPRYQKHARAQNRTTLAVSPSAGEVILGQERSVTLQVTDAVKLNAFDVIVAYDPALLKLDSWSHGGFLSNLSNVVVSNTPGTLRVVATQLATPGVSGDGNLLNLVFSGSAYGMTTIQITKAEFASSENMHTSAAKQNGTLRVHGDPALLTSLTLAGSFALQGRTDPSGIPVSLGYGQGYWLGPYNAVSTNQFSGNVIFSDVYADTYRITTSMPRYLNIDAALNKTKTVKADDHTLTPLQLKGGNALWQREENGVMLPDNTINMEDVNLVSTSYLLTGTGLDADVNFDGIVNIYDLALVCTNYELTSESTYSTWVP